MCHNNCPPTVIDEFNNGTDRITLTQSCGDDLVLISLNDSPLLRMTPSSAAEQFDKMVERRTRCAPNFAPTVSPFAPAG